MTSATTCGECFLWGRCIGRRRSRCNHERCKDQTFDLVDVASSVLGALVMMARAKLEVILTPRFAGTVDPIDTQQMPHRRPPLPYEEAGAPTRWKTLPQSEASVV